MGKTTTAGGGGGGQNEGRRRRRQKLFVDRLIEDVAKVDFAAPAPAYLENDLGQSNVRRYLLEPGPKDGSHSRCRIVRKKDAFGYCTYVLYADCPPPHQPTPPQPPSGSSGVSSSMQEEGAKGQNGKSRRHGRFEARALCAARKRKKSRRSRMVVSLDVTDIRESSSQYLGKIAATNAAGTRFELFDDGAKPGTWETFERSVREDYEDYSEEEEEDQENEDHKDKSSREDEHNEEEEEEDDDDEENDDLTEVKNRTRLGTVEYNLNPLGIHGPRQMRVEIVNTEETKEGVSDDDDTTKPVIARFKNVLPTWNKKMSAYCLNFNARVTKPSVKNFQLLVDDGEEKEKEEKDGAHEDKEKNVNDATINSSMIDDNKSIAKNAALLREKQRRKRGTGWQKWVLQFGKIGEDVYTMDFRYPFTPLQAFMVCATSLDKKLGCE